MTTDSNPTTEFRFRQFAEKDHGDYWNGWYSNLLDRSLPPGKPERFRVGWLAAETLSPEVRTNLIAGFKEQPS